MKTLKPAFVKRDSIVSGKEYALLLGTLKERFRRSQIKAAVKVNTTMLEYYWEMGRDIAKLHAEAKYGSAFFACLSLDLKAEFPGHTGFSETNLKTAFRWYRFYNQDIENRQQVVADFEMPLDFGKIPWGQHVIIFRPRFRLHRAADGTENARWTDFCSGYDFLSYPTEMLHRM